MKTGYFYFKSLLLWVLLAGMLLPGCTEILYYIHGQKAETAAQEAVRKKAVEEMKDDQLRSPQK